MYKYFVDIQSHLVCVMPRSGCSRFHGKHTYNLVRKCQIVIQMISPQQYMSVPVLHISIKTLHCWYFNLHHSNGNVFTAHFGLKSFYSQLRYLISFHVIIGHLYAIFDEVSVKIICPIFFPFKLGVCFIFELQK